MLSFECLESFIRGYSESASFKIRGNMRAERKKITEIKKRKESERAYI